MRQTRYKGDNKTPNLDITMGDAQEAFDTKSMFDAISHLQVQRMRK
jgi:hypothetical protein